MEICRRWGIAHEVAQWGCPDDYPRDAVYCTSLIGGHYLGRLLVASAGERKPIDSSEIQRKRSQFILDPLFADAALRTGLVDIRHGTPFVSLEQSADDVTVTLLDMESGQSSTLKAAFVAGCDGAGSGVRRAIIPMARLSVSCL
jgi:2-polyprenyl-6-methoxyphenol hydroxylase-like FAD-dependent oxidoreductase